MVATALLARYGNIAYQDLLASQGSAIHSKYRKAFAVTFVKKARGTWSISKRRKN
jgi:hypothetical protein